MAHEFSDASFKSEVLDNQEVLDNNKVTVIDLWAPWCGPCLAMSPIVEALATEYDGKAVIGKLNIDDNPEMPTAYGVRGIPTFLLFKGGELKERVIGLQSKESLKGKIDALLA